MIFFSEQGTRVGLAEWPEDDLSAPLYETTSLEQAAQRSLPETDLQSTFR